MFQTVWKIPQSRKSRWFSSKLFEKKKVVVFLLTFIFCNLCFAWLDDKDKSPSAVSIVEDIENGTLPAEDPSMGLLKDSESTIPWF